MPRTDMSLAECHAYRPHLAAPADLAEFWDETLGGAQDATAGSVSSWSPVSTGLTQIRTFDVTVPGYAQHPVRGWFHIPVGREEPLGCVVEFLGYGRGRGLPHENLLWASAGYAHLVVDTRGQGWTTPGSATSDPDGAVGAVPGYLTRGVGDPHEYYYRRLYTDAVRCVAAARAHPAVDAERVAVAGVSQGGGVALAVAGLVPDLAAALIDVPFLCDFRRATDVATRGPYLEITEYLHVNRDQVDTVFGTLDYFDAALLAERASAPALFSIAMRDEVCPPSTCFAAYNRYPAEKELRVYAYNGHEGGGAHHTREQLAWLGARWGSASER